MVLTPIIKAVSSAITSIQTSELSTSLSRRDLILIGSAGLVTSTLLLSIGYKYFLGSSNSSDLAPALSEDETRVILTAILEKVKLLAAKMVGAANNIKQQIQAQGQDMEDSKIMSSFILPHFTSGYRDIQSQLLNEYEVEEYELEEAVKEYISLGDEKLKEITKKIRKLYQTCGGDVDIDEEEESSSAGTSSKGLLPMETVIEMLQVLSEIVSAKTDEYVLAFKEKYGIPREQDVAEAFQQGMMSLSESAEAIVEKQYGVSHDDFEKSLVKYSNKRELQEVYFMMQHASQMKLQAHGFLPTEM